MSLSVSSNAGSKLKFHGTDTDVRWGCMRVMYTCTIHDKLSCTSLQNYTIGASLKSLSVSVSVPWNLSFIALETALFANSYAMCIGVFHCVRASVRLPANNYDVVRREVT